VPDKPYSRNEYNRALILNALMDPFNVVLLAVLLIAAILISPVLLPVAGIAYLAGAARTYFDKDEAEKVLARERGERKGKLEPAKPRLNEATLTPGIAKLVRAAREREARIRQAIEVAELPYDEVAGEVDTFVLAMEGTARRAQSLADALRDTPPQRVQERLLQISDDPTKTDLKDALTTQKSTLDRMQKQLVRFGDEMERILVELDTIRSQIVSVGATTGAAKGQEIAGEVRALREQMGAVADGMAAAYEEQP
jgi:predicted  nucleic acid-binding Zn-ribbon protein